MKAIKLILVFGVVGLIGFFVIKSLIKIEVTNNVQVATNQFASRVEQEISAINQMPDYSFCKDKYNEVKYHIDDYYKDNRFGNNQSENDQWKENLTKNLYSTYTNKFIKQVYFVFNHHDWPRNDLHFIDTETKFLSQSPHLKKGSPVDNSFVSIQKILAKYFEIESFITKCKIFQFNDYSIQSGYPFSTVEDLIFSANEYKSHNLGNQYVNNCSRLHAELKDVPDLLFESHARYLNVKIDKYGGTFKSFNSQQEYKRIIYDKLLNEIKLLNGNTYPISPITIYNYTDMLMNKLDQYAKSAYDYF